MANVVAVMPCLGRAEQTVACAHRLVEHAGMEAKFVLICDGDNELATQLGLRLPWADVVTTGKRVGYWRCLAAGAARHEAKFIVNLANDLLPGKAWLMRAMSAHVERFTDGRGMIGFIDGINDNCHAAHFLVDRASLRYFYGDKLFPTCYDHNYGDTELGERFRELNRYALSKFAVLYHNHELTGAPQDAIYEQGRSRFEDDKRLFEQRKASKWPAL